MENITKFNFQKQHPSHRLLGRSERTISGGQSNRALPIYLFIFLLLPDPTNVYHPVMAFNSGGDTVEGKGHNFRSRNETAIIFPLYATLNINIYG